MTGLLLVGHGTRDAFGLREFYTLAERVAKAAAPQPVAHGFIELSEPTIEAGFASLVACGVTQVRVAPLLLFSAGHAKSDVPAAISRAARAHDGVAAEIAPPFGTDENILALSDRRYREALALHPPTTANDTFWLLVCRGSSDSAAIEEAQRLAAMRAARSGIDRYAVAFVAAARPTLAEGLEQAAAAGRRRIVVQPHLLFAGAVLDEVREAVDQAATMRKDQLWIRAAHLGPEGEIVAAVQSLGGCIELGNR